MRNNLKKVFSSKPFHFCQCGRFDRCTCGSHKRAETQSNWDLRNNSSSISAVLHPDTYDSSTDSDSALSREKKDYPRLSGGDNNCYCNLHPIRPTLLQRPKTCITPMLFAEKRTQIRNKIPRFYGVSSAGKSGFKTTTRSRSFDYDYQHKPDFHYSKDRSNYEYIHKTFEDDKINEINRMDKPTSKYSSEKPHTYQDLDNRSFDTNNKPSSYYNNLSMNQYEQESSKKSSSDERINAKSSIESNLTSKSKLHDDDELPVQRKSSHLIGAAPRDYETAALQQKSSHLIGAVPRDEDQVVFQRKSSLYDDEKSSLHQKSDQMFEAPQEYQNLQSFNGNSSSANQLGQFRKDNYFETHSTGKLLEDIPEHVCIHKFKLTDRLYPQPINRGPFGMSKCMVCDKLMKHENTVNEDQRLRENKLPKFYESGLQPIKINIGTGDNKIYLSLTERDAYLLQEPLFKLKRPQYTNTYALRFQKGVI